MRLRECADALDGVRMQGSLDREITGLTDDSRRVSPGGLFVAVKGTQSDGHRFLAQAVAAGAGAIVVEKGQVSAETLASLGVPVIQVGDSRRALGLLASRFYGEPSRRLKVIGVTGTNGKTTTTYLCKSILEAAGVRVGLIGTVAYVFGEERVAATHTTPGALELQGLLRRMVDAGMQAVVMEVSSHALALERTAGCQFGTAVFTNLTQDHLDFHADMEDYFRAKLRLFTALASEARAIVNGDDPYGGRVVEATRARVWTYAIDRPADLRAEDVQMSLNGVRFTARTPAGSVALRSRLVGRHNVHNILAAVGSGLAQGVPLEAIAEGVAALRNGPERFARVAARYRDVVVVTSDDPRTEDPDAILGEILPGVEAGLREAGRGRYLIHADRRAAIAEAIRLAQSGDLVLIAGKGHEDYQVIGKEKHPFDDRVVAREAIEALAR